MAAAVIGAWAIILAPRFFAPHLRGPPSPTWIMILSAATALAIAWALVFATLAFRRMDEFQQTASKFAWYWGGSIGLAASLPLFVFVYLGGLHWLDPARFHLGPDLALAFRLGYGLAVVSVGLGALIALAVWRIAKR
jgi:hypothetical protein